MNPVDFKMLSSAKHPVFRGGKAGFWDFCILILAAGSWLLAGSMGAWAAGKAPQDVKVALVIGNSDYANAPKLSNPTNDAQLVASAFAKLGFKTVQVHRNLGRQAMISALQQFEVAAESADWAVVYFAGHGLELDGRNFLIPADASLRTDRTVRDEAIELDRVLLAAEGAHKLRVFILDACRDNPFLTRMKRTNSSRSLGRGLAAIEPETGTFVAYAAKHGQVAFDGAQDNSPLVTALVKRLQEPGLEINKLFRLVRDDVLLATDNRQEPFVYASLPGQDFFFNEPAALPQAQAGPLSDRSGIAGERDDFQKAMVANTSSGWDDFLRAYPGGTFDALARRERDRLLQEGAPTTGRRVPEALVRLPTLEPGTDPASTPAPDATAERPQLAPPRPAAPPSIARPPRRVAASKIKQRTARTPSPQNQCLTFAGGKICP